MVTELAAALSMLTTPAAHPARGRRPRRVDCALDDAAWRGARVLDGFHQVHPGDNRPATHATEVRLALTADALYVAVRAEEVPGRVRATLAKRDAIEGDDTVALYLDTFQDRRRAYVVMVNPLGVQQDGVFVEGREPDWSVDLDLRSAGCVDERGYTVEIAVPFASLRWQAGGAGACRSSGQSRHSGEEDSWMPLRRDRVGVAAAARASCAPASSRRRGPSPAWTRRATVRPSSGSRSRPRRGRTRTAPRAGSARPRASRPRARRRSTWR